MKILKRTKWYFDINFDLAACDIVDGRTDTLPVYTFFEIFCPAVLKGKTCLISNEVQREFRSTRLLA